MNEMERDVQRNVSNKYIFYKSINLITNDFNLNDESFNMKCDLMFHLFQFKIHYNLKTDSENDLFFDLCQRVLIEKENNFNHNKRRCDLNFEFNERNNEN